MEFYAVVYGPEWEDVEYFYDIDKAKKGLLHFTKKNYMFFTCLLVTFAKDSHGMFTQKEGIMGICHPEKIVDYPTSLDLIETIL